MEPKARKPSTVRLHDHDWTALQALAEQRATSPSQLIRQAVLDFLRRENGEVSCPRP